MIYYGYGFLQKFALIVVLIIVALFLLLTFILKKDLISSRGILSPNRFVLASLKGERVLSLAPANATVFSEQISEGTGLPDPGKPSVWKYYASPDSTESVRQFYYENILVLDWKDSSLTPSTLQKNCSSEITEPNGICGAIFEKGNKVLWLQVLSTDKTENAGGEKVPSGNKSVISVSVTYK